MDDTKSTMVLPEEVVGIVLKNFSLERTQLFNARLVCRSWNKEALIQLKISKFQMTLRSTSIPKFIKFVQKSSPNLTVNLKQQFVLPFALKFHVRETEETKIRLELERMNSSLESLLNIFEPECIISLSLRVSPTNVEQMTEVIKILAKVSPTIEKLKLKPFKLGQNINVGTVNTLFTNREFSFLKLKRLALSSLKLSYDYTRESPAQLSFCSHLIAKANALMEELTLPNDLVKNQMEISIEMLKQIKSLSVQDFLFVDLVGNNLHAPALPSLTKLQIRATCSPQGFQYQYRRLLESLFSVANSLEYLNIEFLGEKALNLVPFPEFQSMKQLQIQIRTSWNGIPDFVNPSVFPILKSIDMHVDICRLLRNVDECVAPDQEEMSNIKQVTLRLRNQVLGEDFQLQEPNIFNLITLPSPVANHHPFHIYFDYLTARFPNAHKLIIINETMKMKFMSYHEKWFKQFFRGLKESEGAKNFHELEFEDFDKNYLGQIYEETLHNSRIILENVPRDPEFEKMISQIFQNLVTGSGVSSARIETDENQRTVIQAQPNQDKPNQLINLKSLTLRLDSNTKSTCSKRKIKRLTDMGCTTEEIKKLLEGIPNSLNLLSLVRNLPSLEEINISPIMFGRDNASLAKEIQSVNAEYPDMKIITI